MFWVNTEMKFSEMHQSRCELGLRIPVSLCLSSVARFLKGVVDREGLLNSKVLWLVMSNIFFLDCLTKNMMEIFTKEIAKLLFV